MNKLILKNKLLLNTKSTHLLKNHIKFGFNQNNLSNKHIDTSNHSTTIHNSQINNKPNKETENTISKQESKILNKLNINYIKNLIDNKSFKPIQIENNNFSFRLQETNIEPNHLQQTYKYRQQQQKSDYFNKSQLKWLKRLILMLFIVKILQQEGYHCQYDINDMMVTIQLDQRLLRQQQDNQQIKGSQQQKKKKQEQKRKRRSSIKWAGSQKSQRYASTQQMIKHQLQSSQDFDSVQQRIIIKQIQEKRDQSKQNKQKSIQNTNKQNNLNNRQQIKQNIANHIFNNQQGRKQQSDNQQTNKQWNSQLKIPQTTKQKKQFDYSKKPAVLHDDDDQDDQDKPPMTQSQQKIQNDKSLNQYEKTLKFIADFDQQDEQQQKQNKDNKNKLDSWFHMDILKNKIQTIQSTDQNQSQTKQNNNQSKIGADYSKQQCQQKTKGLNRTQNMTSALIDKQNSAVIYLQSDEYRNLSKRIQNFLQLRGINVIYSNKQDNNKQGLKIRLCNKLVECKDIKFKRQNQQDRNVFHHINNLLNPPQVIHSVQQAKQLLSLIQTDQFIIASYIPDKIPQHKQSKYNTFSSKYPNLSVEQLTKQFNQYKYLSSSRKNSFIIIKDKQVADYLKISNSKIGIPYILSKYDKEYNGKLSEPNCKIEGDYYHLIGNMDKIIQKQKLNTNQSIAYKINKLTQKGFTNTNVIEDVHNKIRQLNQQHKPFTFQDINNTNQLQFKLKKLLVIKTNDPKSQKQINQILQKLSKLNQSQISIIKTQSQALLKSLKVISNDQYGTIRLFDLQHIQQPILKQNQQQRKQYFKRYIPNVPFQIQALSKWISNITAFDKPHTQIDKHINQLKSSYPKDLQKTEQQRNAKLVLFYKQGCKGCKLMQQLFSHLVELRQHLKLGNNQQANRLRREICLKYRIQDPQKLIKLQISKFNILNDDQTIQVPQTTPTIYLFNQTNKQKLIIKTQNIFSQLNKIKTGNQQIVQDYMMRELIEEIQKNINKIDNMV